jgi:hypothetical protein
VQRQGAFPTQTSNGNGKYRFKFPVYGRAVVRGGRRYVVCLPASLDVLWFELLVNRVGIGMMVPVGDANG